MEYKFPEDIIAKKKLPQEFLIKNKHTNSCLMTTDEIPNGLISFGPCPERDINDTQKDGSL